MEISAQANHDTLVNVDGEFVTRKILWRILPFPLLIFVVAYLDRINIGFAALQMRGQLNFSDETYGLGAGLFFVGYVMFQLPSNLALQRLGARRWLSLLMIAWGVISSSMMFVNSAKSLYALRFLLGVAESGVFPGILLYFRSWFPAQARAGVVAMFLTAGPISGIIGGPLSGALLGLHATRLAGWQWLFLIEGLPAVVLGFLAYFIILDGPRDAAWLAAGERDWLVAKLGEEDLAARSARRISSRGTGAGATLPRHRATVFGRFGAFADLRIWLLGLVFFALNSSAYSITFWLPISLRSVSGVSDFMLGLLSAIPYLAAVVVMVLFGLHSDRTGERRWHVVAAASTSACAFVMAGYSHSAAGLIAAFSVAMVGVQSMAGPFWALSSTTLTGTTAAVGIALISSIGNLGSGFGPYWIARTRTATGGFRAGLLDFAAFLAIAAVVTILMPLPSTVSKRSVSLEPKTDLLQE